MKTASFRSGAPAAHAAFDIRWYLELLNDPSEGKLKKNQKMFAENAYLSLLKMVGLVNRLLAVTRLEDPGASPSSRADRPSSP